MSGGGKKAVVIAGIGLGLAGLIYLATRVKAAPPQVYPCPYCPETFTTLEDLVTHVQMEHPSKEVSIEWEIVRGPDRLIEKIIITREDVGNINQGIKVS